MAKADAAPFRMLELDPTRILARSGDLTREEHAVTEPCGYPDCAVSRIAFVCTSADHGGCMRSAGELYAQGEHWRFYEVRRADDGSEFLAGRTTPGTNGPRTVEPRCLGCGVATTVTPEQVSLLLSHHMHRVDVRELARYLTT